MKAPEIRQCIKKWELLRLPFNLVCVLGSWLSWGIAGDVTVGIDELPAPTLSDTGVIPAFLYGFAILNVAYSLIYAVEFLGRAISDRFSRWCAIAAYSVGCVFGLLIAAKGSAGIAHAVVTEARIASQREADRKMTAEWVAEREAAARRSQEEAEAKNKMQIQSATAQRP